MAGKSGGKTAHSRSLRCHKSSLRTKWRIGNLRPAKRGNSAASPRTGRRAAQLARRNAKLEIAELPGVGAAGGLGFGMAAFFAAELRPGIEIVIAATNLRKRLANADLCITGEGKLDEQSLHGKTAIGVAGVCREMNIPCIAIAGQVDRRIDFQSDGIAKAFATLEIARDLGDLIARAPELISQLAAYSVSK